MLLNKLIRHQKKCAFCLFTVMVFEAVLPSVGLALTSGPSQPEMQGFEPIGGSNLVDAFSGDFSYSIPLMDVGGYPLNLNYHSGSSADDEASWVGFGWSLTPGAVTRQLRGLPDDFNGSEQVKKQQSFKDNITYGVNGTVKAEIMGVPLKLSLNAGIGVDNYKGIGTTLGTNVGIDLSNAFASSSDCNAGNTSTVGLGGSVGLSTSSVNGSSLDLNVDIERDGLEQQDHESASIGFPYSSRQGLQGMTLGASFNPGPITGLGGDHGPTLGGSSFISFVGPTYTPSVNAPFTSDLYSFSADAGVEFLGLFGSVGIGGYYGDKYIKNSNKTLYNPAYGYMNLEKGKGNINALLDYNLEKDIPYSPEVQYLQVPVPTNDLFMATSQAGSGQYTISRGEPGILFDPHMKTGGGNVTLGIELGVGDLWDAGADLYLQSSTNETQKWTGNNTFASFGDFNTQSTNNSTREHAYFKKIGEPVLVDPVYSHSILGDSAVNNQISQAGTSEGAMNALQQNSGAAVPINAPLGRQSREHRIEPMSYLLANEAALGGLDVTINSYPAGAVYLPGCTGSGNITTIPRVGGYRAAHHLSQLTTIGKDGQRLVYGIPVYNTNKVEATFNVVGNLSQRAEGVIAYNPVTDDTITNQNGTTGYYSKNVVPAYSTSFLLTGMLSPDYVDVTGNGISDDDLGTAVKFNYTKMDSLYQWRTPIDANMVNYNENMLSDTHDDQGNYTYGKKELWYMHSIESKTMIALFITENREDGFGVNGVQGGVDTAVHLQRLKEVRLYSKSDVKAANGNLTMVTPIKVAHFVYAYSLMPGIPNSVNSATGKLTLKEVYFTFGNNQKGMLNPYQFNYYSEGTAFTYHHKQYDRWGQYKDPVSNPSGMNNAEFPFTIQDTTVTNDFASRWQLQTITLPSGGTITVHYESDDYAYVQDQRACQMFQIAGINAVGDSSGLTSPTGKILITLPQPVTTQQDLMFRYFQNMTYLFFKCMVTLDDKGHQEYVPGYGRIQSVSLINSTTAAITLVPEQISGVGAVSPIVSTAWQFIRGNLPQYAYPGSDNLYSPGSDFKKAIESIATAIGNLGELKPNYFPKMAVSKHWGDGLSISKSFVRICSPNFKKLGGGSRVSRLDISDQWGTMTGTTDAKTATYTQTFNYTTTTEDENGNTITISSGVASYEPLIGGEENPFHQPVFYTQKCILQLDRYYYIEQPFGESLYPSPSVGYSKVTVTSLDVGSQQSSTGTTVSEFYTARDYPTRTSNTTLQKLYGQNSSIMHVLFSEVAHSVGLSQGFVVENNDMHGKPKRESVYNRSGELITSTEYDYKTRNQSAETRDLDNHVQLVSSNGQISSGLLNQDVQYFSFMRDASSNLEGHRLQTSGGFFALLFFPGGYFFPGPGLNYDRRDLRSSSTIKLVNNFGVLDKVIKTINGSTITTQNMLWDAQTGDAVLTQTQNEFDDPVYNLSFPAYWMYDGMGMAYQNDGTYLQSLATDGNGLITNSLFSTLLTQGDECLDLGSGAIYWVTNSDGNLRLINRDGTPYTGIVLSARVIHSGRRNLLSGAASTFSTLVNPIVGSQLNLSYATKILDAKASEYNQTWNVPNAYCYQCPPGFTLSADSTYCYQDTAPTYTVSGVGCNTIGLGDNDSVYSNKGTLIYNAGYQINGTGTVADTITNNTFWINNDCTPVPLVKSTSGTCGLVANPVHDDSLAATLCGPLNRCGIWSIQGYDKSTPINRLPLDTILTAAGCFTAPSTGTYYMGVGGDNEVMVSIDSTQIISLSGPLAIPNYSYWHIYPISLHAGQHTIQIQGYNSGNLATVGVEIYNSTITQLLNAHTYSQANVIFTSLSLDAQIAASGSYACPAGAYLNDCGGSMVCHKVIPVSFKVNPYTKGFLGNWRTARSYVFQTARENLVATPAATIPGATNIRTSGAYASFVPYWTYGSTWTTSTDSRWVRKDEATGFSQKGDGIESRDALNNYSSALFGYLQSLPVAVASNARYREIGYDGFEDYGFLLNCVSSGCTLNHFSFFPYLGSTVQLDTTMAHSGHCSLQLTGAVTLSRLIYPAADAVPFTLDAQGGYQQSFSQWTQGFSPIAGKQYILSLWINDGAPRQATTSTSLLVNGASVINSSMTFPVVEGWKRVEVPFTIPVGSTSFALTIQPSGTLHVDDIRIHPFDSEMKTMAYDARSQRLMAEMDENNFATFYEYDDEGILIRVKKETERGIMTIKETRSSYKY